MINPLASQVGFPIKVLVVERPIVRTLGSHRHGFNSSSVLTNANTGSIFHTHVGCVRISEPYLVMNLTSVLPPKESKQKGGVRKDIHTCHILTVP